jgi:hypothetical protein
MFSVFGRFSYDSYLAQGNILYARGTAPLADSLRDQDLNRVWSENMCELLKTLLNCSLCLTLCEMGEELLWL